jgi:hypothetical protein
MHLRRNRRPPRAELQLRRPLHLRLPAAVAAGTAIAREKRKSQRSQNRNHNIGAISSTPFQRRLTALSHDSSEARGAACAVCCWRRCWRVRRHGGSERHLDIGSTNTLSFSHSPAGSSGSVHGPARGARVAWGHRQHSVCFSLFYLRWRHLPDEPSSISFFFRNSNFKRLIELTTLSEATGCRILAKAENLNPGGSVKDRPAKLVQIKNK